MKNMKSVLLLTLFTLSTLSQLSFADDAANALNQATTDAARAGTAAADATKSAATTATTAVKKAAHSAQKTLTENEKININTASKEDIARLPGIGEKKAQAIIKARPFKTPEDLMKVKGIKKGIYNKIKDHIAT